MCALEFQSICAIMLNRACVLLYRRLLLFFFFNSSRILRVKGKREPRHYWPLYVRPLLAWSKCNCALDRSLLYFIFFCSRRDITIILIWENSSFLTRPLLYILSSGIFIISVYTLICMFLRHTLYTRGLYQLYTLLFKDAFEASLACAQTNKNR